MDPNVNCAGLSLCIQHCIFYLGAPIRRLRPERIWSDEVMQTHSRGQSILCATLFLLRT